MICHFCSAPLLPAHIRLKSETFVGSRVIVCSTPTCHAAYVVTLAVVRKAGEVEPTSTPMGAG